MRNTENRKKKIESENSNLFSILYSLFSSAGFTLVETMIAITILTLAIAGPLFTASRAIVAAQNARDQLTASYLAQEGVEYMRMLRDNQYLVAYHSGGADVSNTAWTNFLTAIVLCNATAPNITRACTLDPLSASPLATYSGGAAPLYLTPSPPQKYTQQSSGNAQTAFTRTIQAVDVSATDERIISKVSWNFHGTSYSVTVTDHLTKWQ